MHATNVSDSMFHFILSFLLLLSSISLYFLFLLLACQFKANAYLWIHSDVMDHTVKMYFISIQFVLFQITPMKQNRKRKTNYFVVVVFFSRVVFVLYLLSFVWLVRSRILICLCVLLTTMWSLLAMHEWNLSDRYTFRIPPLYTTDFR